MSKLVQILLSKQLTVNLGRDDQGEAKTIVLQPGLQEVEQDIAEHWFVKAHAQEITLSDALSSELQVALDAANAAIESLTAQSTAADAMIDELEKASRRFHGQIAIKNLHLATSDGVYEVVGDGSILGLYEYGLLDVNVTSSVIHQTYYAHFDSLNGSAAVRQSWAGPGNFTPWRVLDSHVSEISPIPYAGDAVPNGYIAMMGQAISQSSYPILYSVYGAYLLDLRGEFIRGWDAGRNVDFNRGIRSYQGDAIRNITGTFSGGLGDRSEGAFFQNGGGHRQSGDTAQQSVFSFDASRVVPTASENRPRNVALNYIVRAI